MNEFDPTLAQERRMHEMNDWAETIGFIAEERASHPVADATVTSQHGPAGHNHNFAPATYTVTDEGSVRITINGIDKTMRSPAHVRDDSLVHGIHNNPNVPTFR